VHYLSLLSGKKAQVRRRHHGLFSAICIFLLRRHYLVSIKMKTHMRKITLLLAAMAFAVVVKAQTIATFESLPLSGSDTFYVNYSASGTDVGFNDGLAHFPCVYDSSFGG